MIHKISHGQRPAMQSCSVEWTRGRLKTIAKLTKSTGAHAQRHTQNSDKKFVNSDTKFGQKSQKSMPCTYCNQNTCSFAKTHETRGVVYRHVCSSCFSTAAKISNTWKSSVRKKQAAKKRVGEGVDSVCPTRHKNIFWCKDGSKCPEVGVEKCQWKSWFYTSKFFSNKCNGRSFAEVLTHGRQVSTHTVHSRSKSLANSRNTGKHKYSIFGKHDDKGQTLSFGACHDVLQDPQPKIEPCTYKGDFIKPTNKVRVTNNEFRLPTTN